VGEALALDAAWLFAAFLLLLVLAAAGIAARRFLLERSGATVECGLRHDRGTWRLGIASYGLEEFCWFGVFGISMRPQETFSRRDLAVVSRRPPTEDEVSILGPDRIVVECQLGDAHPAPPPGPADGALDALTATSPPGATGPLGATGPPGATGPFGGTGPPGATDLPGATGPLGPPASADAPGAPGSSGSSDAPGAPGVPGARGSSGAPGSSAPGGTVELALAESALTGLLAWLEAAPPGSHYGLAL
jgi:Protein of unknown function (DUF2550)